MLNPDRLEHLAAILKGVPIWGALPGSPAARAGLRYGDVLLAFDTVRTETLGDFLRAHERSGRQWVLRVFRDGEERILSFDVPRASLLPEPEEVLARINRARLMPGGGESHAPGPAMLLN